jgi:hypothetical protein
LLLLRRLLDGLGNGRARSLHQVERRLQHSACRGRAFLGAAAAAAAAAAATAASSTRWGCVHRCWHRLPSRASNRPLLLLLLLLGRARTRWRCNTTATTASLFTGEPQAVGQVGASTAAAPGGSCPIRICIRLQ